MSILQFLLRASPHVEEKYAVEAVRELEQLLISGTRTSQGNHEISELKNRVASLEDENLKLRQELLAHKLGVKHATKGGLDVLAERARQMTDEGYTAKHDDQHDDFSLTSAAIAYLCDARVRGQGIAGWKDSPPPDWNYDPSAWKPKPIRQELVVAAGFAIAEIDRIDRLNGDVTYQQSAEYVEARTG